MKAVASQDVAVQAVVTPPQSSDAAVQAVSTQDQEQTAVQAARAEQAVRAQHQHHHPLPVREHHAGQARHLHHPISFNDVQDMLCTERDYQGLMMRKDNEQKRKKE